ncbi:MAG: DASS family sodium-coupled anion symporter, partial [Phycisphaerales bacterium]
VWLVVAAFIFAMGLRKTGLGLRIAFLFIHSFGGNPLTLAYSMAATNLVLGPAIPSSSARSGGVLFPIVRSICQTFNSYPGPSAKRLGSFLMSSVFHVDLIVCAMFLTSMAANPLSAELARQTLGVTITWGTWALAASVPGIVSLIVIPYVLYKLCPPDLKKTQEAKKMAAEELEKIGPMSSKEKIMLTIFLGAIVLWATGEITKFDGTQVALLGICAMLICNVISWQDVTKEDKAWDILMWMGIVVMLADFLNKSGFIKWFAAGVSVALAGTSWIVALVIAFLVYFYSHYGFASMTAHVTAMYAALIAVAAAAGAPPFLAAFSIAICANLCGCLTHFGTGPAAIFFGEGYVDQATWWRNGFIVSLFHIIIWLGLGSCWWKILGIW